ncbi:MAG TPA: cytochrome c peroxidase [Kofleriaceae bacterium]|jgi:cytochrome c peroxidase|nr:cytochrome c peroxidase [Kofleriaceae bacterium]
MVLAFVVLGCDSGSDVLIETPVTGSTAPNQARLAHTEGVNPRLLRRFKPLRADFGDPTRAQVDLGRMLFFDTRLSKDHDVSCNSCHALDHYGVDNQATSSGTNGQHGRRNAPTVYDAAGEFTSFWDGRAANVEEQAKGPLINPTEMATSPEAAVRTLTKIPDYVDAFHAAFPDHAAIMFDDVAHAIGAFERGLVTPSRWDRYLAGDRSVLSAKEIVGLRVFTDAGCITCHTGELVGGSMFQKVGVVAPWPNQSDHGRAEFTKVSSDDMVFKVPSLRNVAKTGPYFHDGSVATLPDAVRMMARYQIGEELSDADVASIVAWLGALTGDLPATYIQPPTLPADPP